MKAAVQSLRFEPPVRRFLSAGLAVGVLTLSVAAVATMVGDYAARRDEIAVLRSDVEQFNQRAQALGTHQPSSLPNAGPLDFLAPDTDAASAHLQASLRSLPASVETTDVRIDSVRILPPLPEGSTTAVRASVSLSAPGSRVFDVINTLEASAPPIAIDSLRIVSRAAFNAGRIKDEPGPDIAKSELTLALRVYAQPALATSGSARQAGRQASRDGERP